MFTTIISSEELNQNLRSENWVIVDCRTGSGKDDYLQSHIPNARYAHLDNDLSGEIIPGKTGRHPLPSKTAAAQFFSTLGIGPHTQVVVYDDNHGGFAARLWWMLNWLGHEKVALLEGGWEKWQADNLPIHTELPKVIPTQFLIKESNFSAVDASFVENASKTSSHLIIDSRTAPRYRGEHEPIDPIAGHIPNAINLPFPNNLKDGKFLSKEDLKQRFETALEGQTADKTIFYCGSGVTACHNILAMKHAGLGTALLYSGSWSDWITDSKRLIK